MSMRLLVLSFILLSSCEREIRRKVVIIDAADANEEKRIIFRNHCVTCHSFMRVESSPGGFTLRKMIEIPLDSIQIIHRKALRNEMHQFIGKDILDSFFISK